jgi:dihydropyrimidine dehydrogenase (NAD+) subunit PreT
MGKIYKKKEEKVIVDFRRSSDMANNMRFTKLIEESSRCLLCYDPPCSKMCPAGKDPASIIMSLRFKNYKGALLKTVKGLKEKGSCGEACNNAMYCQRNCVRSKIDSPVKLRIVQEILCSGNLWKKV